MSTRTFLTQTALFCLFVVAATQGHRLMNHWWGGLAFIGLCVTVLLGAYGWHRMTRMATADGN